MERSFIVKTVATVFYENYVSITDEEIDEYRAHNPEYAESTDEEIVQAMYSDGEVEIDDCNPVDYYSEEVIGVNEDKE